MSDTKKRVSALETAMVDVRSELSEMRELLDCDPEAPEPGPKIKRPKVTVICGKSRWECCTRADLVACVRDLATHADAPQPHVLARVYAGYVRGMFGVTDEIIGAVKRAEEWAASVQCPARSRRLSDGRAAKAFIDIVEREIGRAEGVTSTRAGERKILDLLRDHPKTSLEIFGREES